MQGSPGKAAGRRGGLGLQWWQESVPGPPEVGERGEKQRGKCGHTPPNPSHL